MNSPAFWIALMLALMAAVWLSVRSSEHDAAQVITGGYDLAVEGAVRRLKLNGCEETEISYETPNGNNKNPNAPIDGHCHVYRMSGGQIIFRGYDPQSVAQVE